MNYTEKLPHQPVSAVNKEGWLTCPHCKQRHALFYRKHSETERTLHYFCDRVKTFWWETHGGKTVECWKYVTRMGGVDLVEGLPIQEDWTAACKKEYQSEHHGKLL